MTGASSQSAPRTSGIVLQPDLPICQQDLPLDWYQAEFKPYAEEYLALPDRKPATVLPWMDSYIRPALEHFGSSLMLLAHYYMGGEIVKLVERYGGRIGDSYELALQTRAHPEVKVFVESAVHFMAEAIAILAAPDQRVWITNPKAGCTMEMMAKDFQVLPAYSQLHDRYADRLAVVAYMNTSGRLKALAGRSGGAVCTSSNASRVLAWALRQGKKVFFVPDRHLGENVAHAVGVAADRIFLWDSGERGRAASLSTMPPRDLARCDRADVILWGGFCGVHTIYRPEHVAYWKAHGYQVLVHPECPKPVVDAADGAGSTKFLWERVTAAPAGSKIAIATEGHFVRNAADLGRPRGIEVVNVADVPNDPFAALGWGCATMARNDPPHLVAILDLLRRGSAPDLNQVLPGDVVSELSGARQRLSASEREVLVAEARAALERMIEITRAAA